MERIGERGIGDWRRPQGSMPDFVSPEKCES